HYPAVHPDASPKIGDVLSGRPKARQAVHGGIIPANLGLAESELALGGKMGRELTLKKALREVSDGYDLVLIDCPPALGLLTVNALVAADHARDTLTPGLELPGIVLNIADMRTRPSREAFESLRSHFGERLLDTTIR